VDLGSPLGSRRALLLYLGAVVGPTLVVLTAGVLAARRQNEALVTLQLTTRSLQERRIADDLERRLLDSAEDALADTALAAAIALDLTAAPERHDAARIALTALRARHPVVRGVYVIDDGVVVFPRLQSSLPSTIEAWLADEPRLRQPGLTRVVDAARRRESAADYRGAADLYGSAEASAASPRVRAWALAGLGRTAAASGNRLRAIGAYRRVLAEHRACYTLAGRPAAVAAAIELLRLHALDDATRRSLAAALAGDRWTVPPDQFAHLRAELGLHDDAALAGRLTALERQASLVPALAALRPAVPGEVAPQAVGSGADAVQLVYRTLPGPAARIVAVDIDLSWLRAALPKGVDAGAAGTRVEVGPETADDRPSFRTILPGWRVALHEPAAASVDPGSFAFTALVAAVLGVLVMGVVLLRRDVQRETELNALRADLVSGISHELKAPASVIRVYAETLDDAPDLPIDQRRQFARALVEEADRLQRLIADVVDFSRIQQGDRTYKLATGSLTAAVGGAAERFRRYAELHGFHVSVQLGTSSPSVRLDAAAVQQAVLNLLDNALKYAGDGRRVELVLQADGREAIVDVCDDGPGIPADQQARMFERFQRGTHPDRGGHGLGLYLVRHVMDAHGGRVELESAPGRGSRFRLRFPLVNAIDDQDPAG
jgi:two-component system phosphate regulon sensor histidine kinase PhoR